MFYLFTFCSFSGFQCLDPRLHFYAHPLFVTDAFTYDDERGLLTETYVSGFSELETGKRTRVGVLLGHTEYYREGRVAAGKPGLGPRKITMFLYTNDIFAERKTVTTTYVTN